jgi:hypothetical protein
MIFPDEYRFLAQEGHLASNALVSGFEAINKIDYDKPGTVYAALFQLATGFERFMKIALILDHKVQHDLSNPTDSQMRSFGHSIDLLYAHCTRIAALRNCGSGWFDSNTLQADVIAFLSGFAKGARYYNLDQLVNGRKNLDPLSEWFGIHFRIAEDHLSERRRCAAMNRARAHCEGLGLFGWEMGPMGRYDLTIDVTFQLEVARLSRGYCVWTLIGILKPIYDLIDQLTAEVHDIDQRQQAARPSVPYMNEFFPFCLAAMDTAVRRKAWTTLFHIAGRV